MVKFDKIVFVGNNLILVYLNQELFYSFIYHRFGYFIDFPNSNYISYTGKDLTCKEDLKSFSSMIELKKKAILEI